MQRERRHAKHGALLMGKCFSPEGSIYTPTYSINNGVQRRYYLEKKTQHRIKAIELESLVSNTMCVLAQEPEHWQACWANGNPLNEAQHRWEGLWSRWNTLPGEQRQQIARQIIERIMRLKLI